VIEKGNEWHFIERFMSILQNIKDIFWRQLCEKTELPFIA
jgi:hypothetical protein